jgi:tetratricopeptide (TPR) repeat protein
MGFATGALFLLAISLYLSDYYLKQQLRSVETGDLQQAREEIARASRLDPFSPAPFISEANLELRQERPEAAVRAFDEAIERDPYNYENRIALGDLQRQQLSDPEAAAQSYREALEYNPHAVAAISRLGDALLNAKDLEGAKAQYSWLRERGKIRLRDLYLLGKIQVQLEESEEAIETFEEARERSSEGLESLDESQTAERENFVKSLDLAVADALVVQGSYTEARELLSRSEAEQAGAVIELLNDDPEGYRRAVLDAAIV